MTVDVQASLSLSEKLGRYFNVNDFENWNDNVGESFVVYKKETRNNSLQISDLIKMIDAQCDIINRIDVETVVANTLDAVREADSFPSSFYP